MEKFIKDKRREVDSILLTLQPRLDSRELSLAYTSLQLAQMWMGKLLGDIGTEYPYREGANVKSSIIDDRADQAAQPIPLTIGRVFAVKELREFISLIQAQIVELDVNQELFDRIKIIYEHLQTAKMWLGQELNNIKLRQNAKADLEVQYEAALQIEAMQAYNRYGQNAGWKNFQGNPMPTWDKLNEAVQSHWRATVKPYLRTPQQMQGATDRPDLWEQITENTRQPTGNPNVN